VTGSSLLSITNNKEEFSVRLKSNRPLSCSYINLCTLNIVLQQQVFRTQVTQGSRYFLKKKRHKLWTLFEV
jgi:hypothetical protein